MNLLLTNDDGVDSAGIKVLADVLSREHNVYVIAPDSNRSAVSSHICMFKNLELKRIEDNVWACSGYPSDCVCVGLLGNLLQTPIDAVISGINYGPNMGTDIVYSGTCAAARQAVLNGVPGIALSVESMDDGCSEKNKFKFSAMAEFALKNLKTLISLAKTDTPRIFVNVNGASVDAYKGVHLNRGLCVREYNDAIELSQKCDASDEYKSEYKPGEQFTEKLDGFDFKSVRDGYVSVKRVYADPIAAETVDGIEFKL